MLSLASSASADAGRGQTLFSRFCSGCHSPRAGDPIAAGAGNPDGIRSALQNVAAMQIVRQLLEPQDILDIADYLAARFNLPPSRPPPPPAPPSPVTTRLTAVEFHHSTLDHYFVSANPAEIAALDTGTTIRGWLRTGATFSAWSTSVGVPGASPVCRFYIPPAIGDSHFYSASPAECEDVRVRFPQFTYESPEVMAVALPNLVTGACPTSTQPVYRLWNMRVDSNHRYAVSLDIRDVMIAKGYVPEGYGPAGVAFCAPI
jgi:cytochrome c553